MGPASTKRHAMFLLDTEPAAIVDNKEEDVVLEGVDSGGFDLSSTLQKRKRG